MSAEDVTNSEETEGRNATDELVPHGRRSEPDEAKVGLAGDDNEADVRDVQDSVRDAYQN